MRAFIFPGQGSQAVGMGKALADGSPAARAVFEEVDDALGQKLSALMAEGPQEELILTANAQPAIMANALATLRASGIDLVEHGFGDGERVGQRLAHADGLRALSRKSKCDRHVSAPNGRSPLSGRATTRAVKDWQGWNVKARTGAGAIPGEKCAACGQFLTS